MYAKLVLVFVLVVGAKTLYNLARKLELFGGGGREREGGVVCGEGRNKNLRTDARKASRRHNLAEKMTLEVSTIRVP